MAYQLKTWTHPTTGEVRIYISGGIIHSGDKVYITKSADSFMRFDCHIKLAAGNYGHGYRSAFGGRTQDWACEIACQALGEIGLDERTATFEDIVVKAV